MAAAQSTKAGTNRKADSILKAMRQFQTTRQSPRQYVQNYSSVQPKFKQGLDTRTKKKEAPSGRRASQAKKRRTSQRDQNS